VFHYRSQLGEGEKVRAQENMYGIYGRTTDERIREEKKMERRNKDVRGAIFGRAGSFVDENNP